MQSALERTIPPPSLRRELQLPPGNSFIRLVTAKAIASVRRTDPGDVAATMWPNDKILSAMLTRAATAPAMTTVAGWAAELVQRLVVDALEALGPASAGAQVLRRGLVLNFDGAGTISAPGFVADFGNAGFVREGNPIPVRQLAAAAANLLAHKLAALAVLSRELIESSNAEAAISDALTQSAGRMLDEVLFDANAADADRPAGLRNGVAASTPSASGDAYEAVFEDIATLINAVAPVGGNGPYVLVGSPGRAIAINLRIQPTPNLLVLGSSAVVNDLLAIAPAALVSALSVNPTVESSKATTLHMEDTAPQPIGSAGPAKSMFQTDSVALKLRWPVTWALRDLRGFAWMTPTWK